jgi:hypothetical protein
VANLARLAEVESPLSTAFTAWVLVAGAQLAHGKDAC